MNPTLPLTTETPNRSEPSASGLRRLSRKELRQLAGGREPEYSVIEVNRDESTCKASRNAFGAYTWAGGKCYLERYM